MSRMKHLLRKLHIGTTPSSINNNTDSLPQAQAQTQAQLTDNNNTMNTTSKTPSFVSSTGERESGGDGESAAYLEEEFQVQLALAISVSDQDGGGGEKEDDVEIKAAKRMSLGVPTPVALTPLLLNGGGGGGGVGDNLVELLSLRYWNYNVVNYEEKAMDGFYDVYGINPTSTLQGKIPLLVDLQATSISDNVDYEVIYVNRAVDPALQKLEQVAESLSLECKILDLGLRALVQKISDVVVETMGGPVDDADEVKRRWVARSYELRSSLNTIVLPLGRLDVGLSRHRALLFKVLADRISLPCRLVKGSYYTGSTEGAVNLIRLDRDSEYIIDLMGAPGALIPAEIPTNHLENSTLDIVDTIDKIDYVPENKTISNRSTSADPRTSLKVDISGLNATTATCAPPMGNVKHSEKNQTDKFEYEFGKLLPSLPRQVEGSSGTSGKASPAQKMKVKDVSKYVISAAQNPEFAQKLHAVLLESGASPPPDLFDLTPRHDLASPFDDSPVPYRGIELPNKDFVNNRQKSQQMGFGDPNFISQGTCLPISTTEEGYVLVDNEINGITVPVNFSTAASNDEKRGRLGNNFKTSEILCSQDYDRNTEEPLVKLAETNTNGSNVLSSTQNDRIDQVFDEVSEWEIPWEDIHIGERIGLGSCGEVYRADWNGTEVAVKKFLDQDFSGDALEQFRCEVKIMLRLRHPNVVLFMGAVTRPPSLSILTEFLPRGSLYRLLHRPNIHLDEKRRLRMALDVAKGMNYLHTSHPTIVHRDLKSPNLLVDKNWVVKVCDFGLSRLKHHTFLTSKSTAGTPEWMAPEVLRNELSNEKCDVYSFGVILWELATLRMPWSGMNPMQVVGAVGFQNRRLEIPDNIDPTIAKIICDCWHSDPNLRPSFLQLMSLLKRQQRMNAEKV